MSTPESASSSSVRLGAGASLLETAQALGLARGDGTHWFRAVGMLTRGHLTAGLQAGDPVVAIAGTCVLASCDVTVTVEAGRAHAQAFAVLGFDAHGAWTTRAGRLTQAVVQDVTLVVVSGGGGAVLAEPAPEPAAPAAASPAALPPTVAASAPSRSDALRAGSDMPQSSLMSERASATLQSRPDPPRSMAPAPRPEPAARPAAASASAPAPASAWDKLAAWSAGENGPDEDEDEIDIDDLKPNARLLHPKLGELRVLRVLPDGAVNVELPGRHTRKLKLTPFQISLRPDGKYQLRLRNDE